MGSFRQPKLEHKQPVLVEIGFGKSGPNWGLIWGPYGFLVRNVSIFLGKISRIGGDGGIRIPEPRPTEKPTSKAFHTQRRGVPTSSNTSPDAYPRAYPGNCAAMIIHLST